MNVKRPLSFFALIVLCAIVLSCDSSHDAEPQVKLTPVSMKDADHKIDLTHASDGKLQFIRYTNYYPNDVVLTGIVEYIYGQDGRLEKTITDSGDGFVFHYEGDRIASTDEYIGDEIVEQHTFTYDDRGRLADWISWQDIPEEGGHIPVKKYTYRYDGNDNLTENKIYYYASGEHDFKLLSIITFSDYDTRPNAEDHFERHAFNPIVVLRKNNPGKLISTNAAGLGKSESIFSYSYDKFGYPSRKVTTTLENDQQYTSTIDYVFEE
ncbi:MAG TPA: hypothetical protein VIN08_11725 [Ohtaekwangia sp.]|uniref:hypothetical protein n=1 Tax=Ohtaekwangia sp. TaxID=2066019 RepID=UPI002F94E1FC